ncbi:TBC1 domain family member 23 [Diaphorina citri]|uniref:TBC1 domain family member 23 n=1 Tax=Diaphorina citri TaxID=121845 RepID=A0A3Q0JE03_DIACI|nr:TBC1 domain family member 23 [Diaphorina citri]
MCEDNSTWMQELELALQEEQNQSSDPIDLDDTPATAHEKIAETFRPQVWKKYLDIGGKESKVIFSDIYDLPEQNELRSDCKQIVEKLGNDDEDKVSVLSDLESILTHFRKSKRQFRTYRSDNGWIELLFPVIALKLPKQETYNLFEAIHSRYIVRHHDVFHTLTLLILYHDPHLSNFLVTKKITSTHVFTKSWFQSLFAAQCNLQVVYAIWDLYFQQEDPFFIFFLALVIIVNARDQILALKDEPKEKIIEALSFRQMLQEPTAFATAVQGLLSCQRAAIKQGSQAGGEHVCFLGCGQLEEDQYTHMVVSSFLQRQIQFISLVQVIHTELVERPLASGTVVQSPVRYQAGILAGYRAAMKSKSAEVKEKLFEIITPSSSTSPASGSEGHRFKTSAGNRKSSIKTSGKRYRNIAPVFSIDDDHDPGDIDRNDDDIDDSDIDSYSTISAWLKKPEVIASFECQQINMQGYMCDSILLVTATNLIVLREIQEKQGCVEMMVNRRLSTIGRITTKKKHPEFSYNY